MPFVKIPPAKWPQDELAIPRGIGQMPPVEFGNKNIVGAEFFSLAADFTFLHTLGPANVGPTITTVIPTPQDGDFWCDQISIIAWATFAGQTGRNIVSYPDGFITIKDVRTQRSLINSPLFNTPTGQGFLVPKNSVPWLLFRKFPPGGLDADFNYNGNQPVPTGFRDVGTLIQPFCFTRQGGIEVSMTSALAPPGGTGSPFDYTLTVCFGGWKEYANASH